MSSRPVVSFKWNWPLRWAFHILVLFIIIHGYTISLRLDLMLMALFLNLGVTTTPRVVYVR